ncbi:fungal-specific transcription factor domain-containing protein [Bisporella sp. PMI_857]|nr:fungal-specific transcription factor domain-containing protein [Bisporella sp. PMI_857]
MPYERSQTGCWTCRVRKKKCDETFPICTSCHVRGITCHGFGQKPEWMDGGAREKEVLVGLQKAVKENLKKKRSYSTNTPMHPTAKPDAFYHAHASQNSASSLLTPPPSNGALDHVLTPYGEYLFGMGYKEPSCLLESPEPDDVFTGRSFHENHAASEEFEKTLLMNFIDAVFPLLFNCYTPPVPELGRGWLLVLLTRTKPMYHTALCLSAFYMRSVLLKTGRVLCPQGYSREVKRHHTIAFRELQVQLSTLCNSNTPNIKTTIETVACIIQLISVELIGGGTNSWQLHLEAAASLVPTLTSHLCSTTHLPSLRPSLSAFKASFLAADGVPELPPTVEDIACDFLIGTLIWYDIIACASTNRPPLLKDKYTYITTNELSTIMGCESWAMILISRISELHHHSENQLSCLYHHAELAARSAEIEKQLREGLASNEFEFGSPITHPESISCQKLGNPRGKIILLITRIYAFSALTYLHVVVSGPNPRNPLIVESVKQTMECFRQVTDGKLFRSLIWPICVSGCMAGADEAGTGYLAGVVGREILEGCAGNLEKAWEVVKECWRLRATGKEVGWWDTMAHLKNDVLLV